MADKSRILIVEDHEKMRDYLARLVRGWGYGVRVAASGAEAVALAAEEPPEAALLDLRMEGMDGLETLARIKSVAGDRTSVVIVSGVEDARAVAEAIKGGAADFIKKPFEPEELEVVLAKALEKRALAEEVRGLRRRDLERREYDLLFAGSEAMRPAREIVDQIADTNVTVLIRGESGTGKGLAARAIHARSRRADRPFVTVNCAALPDELLESELFGYEPGAFTGASRRKPGKFELAHGGTIFLDEIGEMPPLLQAKLLQVLQDGEFAALGGREDVRVDARVIAATNADIERSVASGGFREDLYYRLNVVGVHLPPLRARREEVPILVDHFLRRYAEQYGRPLPELSAGAWDLLLGYDWPGNVRELENAAKRVVVLGGERAALAEIERRAGSAGARPAAESGVSLEEWEIEPPGPERLSLKDVSKAAARAAERRLIRKVLERTRWNRKDAAEILQISYKALLYKIKDTGLGGGA